MRTRWALRGGGEFVRSRMFQVEHVVRLAAINSTRNVPTQLLRTAEEGGSMPPKAAAGRPW
eukprot:SAG22_NODE_1157_length_5331_cov_1.886086_8_plen_61_part_00